MPQSPPGVRSATPRVGIICDDCSYTSEALAFLLGRNLRLAKEFIRKHLPYADLGNGLLIVSGSHFRLAMEQMANETRASVNRE